jgi:hypothetical protein
MKEVEKKKPHTSGKGMTSTRSRYCRKCDAMFSFQCECPNHKAMAWQRENVFHIGKRYKGKKAWKELYPKDIKYKTHKKSDS